MQHLSIFDMFKIGVGPSSSHTMGPWKAVSRFLAALSDDKCNDASGGIALDTVQRFQVDLYGSLAKTGKGHGTDVAVMLGLSGESAETIQVDSIFDRIDKITQQRRLMLRGVREIAFDPATDILFHRDQTLPYHPNGIRLTAYAGGAKEIFQETYFSTGGGFVETENETPTGADHQLPFPIDHATDLLRHCDNVGRSIANVVLQNELTWRKETEVRTRLAAIRGVMTQCVHRGCRQDGVLPGGLNVHRRAEKMASKLIGQPCNDDIDTWHDQVRQCETNFQRTLDWVSCFALAVNEENAAFGRVVTAPTNGAAGVIPAVMLYGKFFCGFDEAVLDDFLLVAGEIGCLFKKNATISAAMGGCQAEIGVSSAMAAAALAECLGGTPQQSSEAAEIAMEHHLGLTCDPIGGLVQIPCIERNAMGAIKAITAAQLALQRDVALAKVSLDAVIETMWQTAQDMNAKYKETSEAGLAVQIPVNVSEC